jgi:hypothetical protein
MRHDIIIIDIIITLFTIADITFLSLLLLILIFIDTPLLLPFDLLAADIS